MTSPTTYDAVWVGDLKFHNERQTDSGRVYECTACGKEVASSDLSKHARKKHRDKSKGVLAGQMGLPYCNVPDVPR